MKSKYAIWVFIFCSCTTVKVSRYYRCAAIENGFYQGYYNDSLLLAINFNGAHEYDSSLKNLKKVQIPRYIKKLLKQTELSGKPELFFISKPDPKLSGFDYSYLGFITKHTTNKSLPDSFYSATHTKIYYTRELFKTAGCITAYYQIPLARYDISFLCSKKTTESDYSLDSFLLTENTRREFGSVFTGENYDSLKLSRRFINKEIKESLYSNNYISAVKNLKNVDTSIILNLDNGSYFYQSLLTRLAFLDDLPKLKALSEVYKNYINTDRRNIKAISQNAQVSGDAFSYLLKKGKEQKVLMFNESHYDFRHRLFINLLLEDLYKIGYRHLCLEDKDSSSTADPVSMQAGFYIREPQMADLIRTAKAIGYQIHPFDYQAPALAQMHFKSKIEAREYNQGYNLSQLYKKDPSAKWIVLSGYDHINKQSFMEGVKSAFLYFAELSGVTPYSINQSYFSDISNNYVKIADGIKKGYYIVDSTNAIYKRKQSDMYIVNNIADHPYQNPFERISSKLALYNIAIPQNEFAILEKEAYLFIYVKDEYAKNDTTSIPIYITRFTKSSSTSIYLPVKENYTAVIADGDGHVVIHNVPLKRNL